VNTEPEQTSFGAYVAVSLTISELGTASSRAHGGASGHEIGNSALAPEIGRTAGSISLLGEGRAQMPAGRAVFLMREISPLGLCTWLKAGLRPSTPIHGHGTILRKIVRHGECRQFADTFFFRNRPQLELIRRLIERDAAGTSSNLTIAGCDPDLIGITGLEDIVVATNFRCHLRPGEAETCLRNPAAWKMRYASAFQLGEGG
jgi:hypothetical protein